MKFLTALILSFVVFSCKTEINIETPQSTSTSKIEINKTLDNWHKAAAEANFNNYF